MMAPRRSRRRPVKLTSGTGPRWGATEAQGRRNAERREIENRFHELETKLLTNEARTSVLLDKVTNLEIHVLGDPDRHHVVITTTSTVIEKLNELVQTGLHGTTIEEVAEELIRRAMRPRGGLPLASDEVP